MVESTYYETVCGDDVEPFTLIDSKRGVIPPNRLPYVLKQVRMNGRHITYMLKHIQVMPKDLETYYAEIDANDLPIDLDSYEPSHPT